MLCNSTAVAAAGQALKITAPANVYAHIFRDFPADDGDEIVLEARIKSMPFAGSSWVGSIGLYWFPTAFVTLGQQPDGQWRSSNQGLGLGGRANAGIPAGDWVTVRIQLTSTHSQLWMKGKDDWVKLSEAPRPSLLAIPPFEIIVGKGFGAATAPYLEEHLDNSYEDPGEIGVVYIDDLALSVDGEALLRETFDTLDGWDVHVDPNHAEAIRIELVPESEADAAVFDS